MMSSRGTIRLMAVCLALLAAGCASTGDEARTSGGRDIVTASDETDADRRARARFELAVAYFSRGQPETALDEIKQAIAARPGFASAFNLRGLIYGQLGETKLAQESFQRALQLDPRDADAMHNYAWFECQSDRFAEAEKLFERAIAVPQNRAVARTLLAQGLCYSRAQRPEDAERTLLRSYELDAGSPATAANLAQLLYRRGAYERARFYAQRVTGTDGAADAATLWLAARIERKLGNLSGADKLGRDLAKRFPQSPEAVRFERGQFND